MRWPSIACRFATGTSSTSARSCGSGSSPPRDTPSPTCRMRWRPRGGREAMFTGGSLLYGSTGRPDLLGAAHRRRAGARPVRVGAPPGGRSCRRMRTSIRRARSSAAAAQPPRPGRLPLLLDHRPGGAGQPALVLAEQRYVRELLAGEAGCLPRLLCAHWARRTRPPSWPGPESAAPRGHAASCGACASRLANGWWTCAPAGRFAAGHLAGTFSFDLVERLRALPRPG